MLHVALALFAAVAVCQLAILLTTVYLHRALAHRAITVAKPVSLTMRALIWITTGIKPRQWVAVHRKHHAFTDVEGDPHSPILEGFAAVQFGNVGMYRRALRTTDLVDRYAKDLPPDRWDRVLFDHAFVGLGMGIGLLCVTLGWELGLAAAALHTVTYLLLNASINAVGHTYGTQPHANTSRNNQWLALLTGGEGLHNNHHAAPTSARFSLDRGQLDPGWWAVRFLTSTKLARLRHHEVKFKVPTPA
jgi:stearoyl-CoA desaturase (delta-9 desaturase)